jgi:hypothetical protein
MEILKIFEIYLHQLTPEAIMRMGIFVWAVRSQGLEPNAKSFCNIHELLYEMKPWGKEQYHNNFGCYSFGARSGSSCPMPTFQKRWPALVQRSSIVTVVNLFIVAFFVTASARGQ